jgi:Protein of unknown function (DUF4236)/Bacterial SH3 domain
VLSKFRGGAKVGWRFRRTVKILPGVRLNISRSGVSTTLGPNGASINLGKRGTRTTVGIPGTGISHSSLMSPTSESGEEQNSSPASTKKSGCGIWAIVAISLFALGKCVGGVDPTPTAPVVTTKAIPQQSLLTSQPEARATADSSSDHITGEMVEGRTNPSSTAKVLHVFQNGDVVRVVKRKRNWIKVIQNGVTFWVLAKHISSPARASHIAKRSSLVSRPSKQSTKRNRASKRSGFSGGSCPCRSGRICTGPRGGRYCITSGGNKKYGV